MNYKLFILLIIALQFTACKSNEENETIKLNKEDYTISYPSTMKLDDNLKKETEFVLFYKEASESDKFRENINLIIQDLRGLNLDLDKYAKISEDQINNNATLILSERIESDFSDFQKIIFTRSSQKNDLKFLQYYFVQDNKAYVLTFSSTQEDFDTYYSEMEKVMSTFRIK